MEALAIALVLILCTPLGWAGMAVLGMVVFMICESIKRK